MNIFYWWVKVAGGIFWMSGTGWTIFMGGWGIFGWLRVDGHFCGWVRVGGNRWRNIGVTWDGHPF